LASLSNARAYITLIPPPLALLICFGFAFWVYRRDTKHNPDLTRALWLPTLWMMRCGSRGIDSWVSTDDARLDPIFVFFMLLTAIVVLARRPARWNDVIKHNSAVFLFYAFLIISLLWADELESPFVKMFRPLTDLSMALVVVTEPKPKEAILAVFRRTAILLIPLSIVLIRYYSYLGCLQSKHGEADMWIGVTTHKNPLGQLCVMSSMAYVWSLADAMRNGQRLTSQWVSILYLLMTVYLFRGGGESESISSTSIFCCVIGIALFLALGRMAHDIQNFVKKLMIISIVVIFVFAAIEVFDLSPKALIAESQGKDATLAGRTLIWQESIRLGMEHPILGSGYGAFWVPSIFNKLDPGIDNMPMQAHNGYIEAFVNLGFVGLGLLLAFIGQSITSAVRHIREDFDYGRLRLVILAIVLVMNYTEATISVGAHIFGCGFLMVAIYAEPWTRWPRLSEPMPTTSECEAASLPSPGHT